MALTTWVARFVVDHGRVTEEGNRLRSFERRRLDEPDVDLHVLHEPHGAKAEELGTQALDAIGRLFLGDRLSLTGALTRALSETHQTLVEWNRRSLPRDQVGIGVTAALVGSNVVYLAQAGPGVVYLRHGDHLERLTPTSTASQPLGEGPAEPSLRRIELADGDLLLAASTALDEILRPEALRGFLDRETDEILPDLYLLTRDLPAFALFAITCIPEEAETPADDDGAVALATGQSAAAGDGSRQVTGFIYDTPYQPKPPEGPLLVYPEPRVPVDISRTVVNLRNDRATGRNEYARTTGSDRPFNFNISEKRLLQIAAAVAVVLVLIVFVPDLVREGRSEQVTDLIAGAQANLAAAAEAVDPAQRRLRLEETRRLATEALRIEETNTVAEGLRVEASQALEAMNAVFDLSPLTSLVILSSVITGEIAIQGLSVNSGQVYLLDTGGGRVIAIPADGSAAPAVLYEDGATYAGIPARAPIEFTWEGDDASGRLLVLDAERKLFEVRPGSEPQPLPLRATSTWTSVTAMAAYDGNLYVLDPQGNQVHRYLPAAEGYDSEPDTLLAAGANLAGAVDMAIDGDVYIVFSDGRTARFVSGQPAPFPLGGIDRGMTAASDIALVPAAEEVYLADSGNKRIVVAGTDGVFHRQFVANAITDIAALGVNPSGAQLYVVVGDQLFTAPIVR